MTPHVNLTTRKQLQSTIATTILTYLGRKHSSDPARKWLRHVVVFGAPAQTDGFLHDISLERFPMFELILGTGNQHKVIELREMLPQGSLRLLSLKDIAGAIDVDETGSTFGENARLKATVQAKHLKQWVLAEDSGLSVDALDGRPGVFSARFAGKHGDDQANNRLLLQELSSVPHERRGASFTCHIAVSDPTGTVVLESTGICRGNIAATPSGDAGFGYDPLFTIPEYHLTFAQLGSAVKNVLSHRSRALRQLLPSLTELIRQQS